MFDWFWEFLYMISSTLFRLIDGLILCANKLCGIDTITFEGEETDFLSHLLFSDKIGFAFRVSAILATILLVIFTVFMIMRSITNDRAEETPAHIALKAFKTILMLFFVPTVMIAFMMIGNAFVNALYGATVQSSASPGAFLFCAFAEDGGMKAEFVDLFRTGELDYKSAEVVSAYMNLSDFPFIFSFIAGAVVLCGIGSAMLIFVDRVLSLVILYIAAPISISTSVLDDGARFKLWRDQFLSKFIMGYGMILAINIYAIVCSLVMNPYFVFFSGEDVSMKFLDLIMKLLVVAGGALTMQKSMALIGNLVASGAGSNELRDNAFTAGGLARMAAGGAGKALGVAGLLSGAKAAKSILGDAVSMKSRDLGSKLLNSVGLGTSEKSSSNNGSKNSEGTSGAKNNEKADYGAKDVAKNAIAGTGFKTSFNTGDNANNNRPGQKNNNMVANAINAGGRREEGNK